MKVSSQKTGSKVNGLEQPFHPRRFYCLLQYAPSDVGDDYRKRWNEMSYRWFGTKEKAEAFCIERLYQTKIQLIH